MKKRITALVVAFAMLMSNSAFARGRSTTAQNTQNGTTQTTQATTEAATEATTEAVTETTTQAAFSDVDPESEVGVAVDKMYALGYLKGYEDGTFRPNGSITRAELTRIFNQVFEYDEPAASDKADFSDNSDKEAWYYNDVRIAQTNGYIAGFEDNTFRPKDNFTRQQTCVVLAQIAGLKSPDEPDFTIEDEVSEWALDYVAAVIANGDMPLEAGNTFRAKENITRGEVCLALSKYVKYVKVAKPVLDENGEVVTNEQGETVTEYVTETTTQSDDDDSSSSSSSGRTSSGGSSSSSSSSGGSSSGSSSSSNTTTTEATTETTTETVTEAVTETTTEAVTEAETETTTEATFGSDEESALKNIILQLDSFAIPNATSPAVSDILTQIVDTMTEFYNDHDYDVESDMYDVADKVDNLNAEDRSQLISLVLSSCSISDLTQVGTFFKPILRNFSGYLDELGIS